MINKLIHQTWKDGNIANYHEKVALNSHSSWILNYRNFDYKLWTDEDIYNLISTKYSFALNAYENLDQNIKKVDLARYIILYEYGGVYADLDFISCKQIPEIYFDKYNFLGYKARRGHIPTESQIPETIERNTVNAWVLGQAFFACKKNFEPLLVLIENIVSNYQLKTSPLLHTGPEKIHKIMLDFYDIQTDSNVHIFDFNEIGNDHGVYGFHQRLHNWDSGSSYKKNFLSSIKIFIRNIFR